MALIADISIWTPAASTTAVRVDRVCLFLLVVCTAVGLLVASLLIGFSIFYRRREGDRGMPPATCAPRWLEWFWTLTPLLIFVGMFAWGATIYYSAFSPPPDAMPLYVVGKQWMWKVQHP